MSACPHAAWTDQAMELLRERPRGTSVLSPAHPTPTLRNKQRYTVDSHEVYLGKIFAAGECDWCWC